MHAFLSDRQLDSNDDKKSDIYKSRDYSHNPYGYTWCDGWSWAYRPRISDIFFKGRSWSSFRHSLTQTISIMYPPVRVYPAPHTHIITASSAAIVAPEDVVFRITGFTIWRSVPSQRDGYHTDVLSFVGFSCRFESRQ